MCLSRVLAVCCALLSAMMIAPAPSAQQSHLDELTSQVTRLIRQGRYAEATPIATEALRIAEATFGPNDRNVAMVLDYLAQIYDGQSKFAEAEPLYERALQIDEKVLGPEDPNVATDLNNLATLYGEESKYAEAEPLFERAIQIDEKSLGPNDSRLATDLNNLAELYRDRGRYAEAEPLYLRALQIDEKASGENSPDLVPDLNNLAGLYVHQDKFAQAEPLYQRAIHIEEKAAGPDHPDVATLINNLALLYVRQGRYGDAEPLYQRAQRIHVKAFGPEDPHVALDLNNLAELDWEQGKYADAEPLFKRALQIHEKALGPDHPKVAMSLNNLAQLYREEGKYADAEPLYHRALSINEKALGLDHPAVATNLNNLAALYTDQGRFADAEPLLQRALRINEKAFGLNHSEVAKALNNLAVLYDDQGRYGDAEPLYQRALQINEKALGPEHAETAIDLNNLARLYREQGRNTEAEPLYQRAMHIDEKTWGTDHPHVATDLNNLARLYDDEGKYAEAEPLYQRALRIEEKTLGPEHPKVATIQNNLALLYDNQGKYAEAEPVYQRSFDGYFRQFQYSFTYMTEKERLEFLDTVSSQFPGYFSFVYRYQQKDPGLAGAMYNLLLWEKGFIATSIAGMRRQIEASGDQRAIDLLSQLASKRTQLAALLNVNPPDRELWRKQIDQLRADADEIEKTLVARSAAFAEKQKLDRASWQQVRDELAPNEAAVEFTRFRYYDKKWTDKYFYVALVVTHKTKDQPQFIFLGESRQVEGSALTPFQQSMQTRGLAAEEEISVPGRQAYDLIWKPLEIALAGKTRIYLAADGALNEIPIGLMPAPDGKLLMERFDLRLVASTKDILRDTFSPTANTALLVGDPMFDLTEDQQRAALETLGSQQLASNPETPAVSPNTLSRDATSIGAQLPRLEGTGTEVTAIGDLMQRRGWKSVVYLQQSAQKHVVEQAAAPRVIHLATHGFFLPDQHPKSESAAQVNTSSGLEDPMLRSGLYFAGANRTLSGKPTPEGLDNGVLTAMEAASLNLSGTELVVLSACNTGRGDIQNGEGVFGLRRALQEAGARAVLMSLWSVPDKETQELMRRFYSKWLSGTEMHKALMQSQLEIREKARAEHDGHDLPYYWGAFVLVGK